MLHVASWHCLWLIHKIVHSWAHLQSFAVMSRRSCSFHLFPCCLHSPAENFVSFVFRQQLLLRNVLLNQRPVAERDPFEGPLDSPTFHSLHLPQFKGTLLRRALLTQWGDKLKNIINKKYFYGSTKVENWEHHGEGIYISFNNTCAPSSEMMLVKGCSFDFNWGLGERKRCNLGPNLSGYQGKSS